jgi:hypothetical protein
VSTNFQIPAIDILLMVINGREARAPLLAVTLLCATSAVVSSVMSIAMLASIMVLPLISYLVIEFVSETSYYINVIFAKYEIKNF